MDTTPVTKTPSRFSKKKATIMGVSAIFVAGVLLVITDKLKSNSESTDETTKS